MPKQTVEKLALPDVALNSGSVQALLAGRLPALHQFRELLFAIRHRRGEQMNMVRHDTDLRDVPIGRGSGLDQRFKRDLHSDVGIENNPPLDAANGHKIDHPLIRWNPHRNPFQVFAVWEVVGDVGSIGCWDE